MSNIISIEQSVPTDLPLLNRVLMLNTAKANRFQCRGFFVTRNHPIEIVIAEAPEEILRAAIREGKLLDITDNQDELSKTLSSSVGKIDSAIKDGTIDKPIEGEEISKILIGKDSKGNSYIFTPKDDADYERMQQELATFGYITIPKPKLVQAPGLSSITVEDIN